MLTGQWATKAYKEAARYGDVQAVASSKEDRPSPTSRRWIPAELPARRRLLPHLHEQHHLRHRRGTELPDTGNVPLVADISSCILSEPIDVSRFGLLYAGAQKNMGPAGLTVVIVREDLLGEPMEITPTMFNYKIHGGERLHVQHAALLRPSTSASWCWSG